MRSSKSGIHWGQQLARAYPSAHAAVSQSHKIQASATLKDQMRGTQRFSWAELSNVPDKPGIYAWYFCPQITAFDLEQIISDVRQLTSVGKIDAAAVCVKEFLDYQLFRYFKEGSFTAKLSGALKPAYEGELEQIIQSSASLIERLQENPGRLKLIAKIIDVSAAHFASPIYIGISAKSLRGRIAQHRALIERFRSERGERRANGDERTEASFALEVVKRGVPLERLFVSTCIIESTESVHADVENILNRIYHPILGRN